MTRKSTLLATALVAGLAATAIGFSSPASAQGWGMMGGYGPGYYGHMGYGPGYGPGWMHRDGYGPRYRYHGRNRGYRGYGPGYGWCWGNAGYGPGWR